MEPMPTVVTVKSICAYPEVTHNANAWLWSNVPRKGTVLVTEHGLRRLLRFVAQAQDSLLDIATGDPVDKGRLNKLLNESSTIFCEQALVMSRLFVTDDGNAVAHPDKEVDDASIPPWER